MSFPRAIAGVLISLVILVVFGIVAPANALAHGTDAAAPTELGSILLAWHLDVPLILGLLIAAAAYLHAARQVDRAHPRNRWQRSRTAAFLGALAAVAVALVSPVDALSGQLMTVHMVQHLLLTMVAPPLLAASGIGTLALRAASPSTRRRVLLPVLHSRLMAIVTFPVVGWLALAGAMWGSHFSSLYDLALTDDSIHALEHAMYFGAASLFWWPIFSPDPLRWRLSPAIRIGSLLAQFPQMSFLALAILSADRPLYPTYLGRTAAYGMDALLDQRIAGAIMWATGDLVLIGSVIAVLLVWMRAEEAEADRADARADRKSGTIRTET